jgi:autotransporter-associated beta strand protein
LGDACGQTTNTWNLNANGNWNSAANWNPNTSFPDAIDASARFGSVISANRTITLGQNLTVGTLRFDDNNSYTLSGLNTLTFDVSAGSAAIDVTTASGNGAHTISSGIALSDPLMIAQGSSGSFTISGVVSGMEGITKAGVGNLVLSGANSFSGGVDVECGDTVDWERRCRWHRDAGVERGHDSVGQCDGADLE